MGLAQRLAALPEMRMREVVLVEELRALHPARAAEAMDELLAGARAGSQPAYLLAVTALAGALGRIPYDVACGVYEAAKAAGLTEVARLLFAAPPGEEPEPKPERYIPEVRRALTLGERKALARRGRREIVALLADPDAAVIHNVLANPRTTEKDVLAVAARRPARADVQREIFASRWCARYHVKRALVLNPSTPADIALRLLPALVETDLRFVVDDGNLSDAVRVQARLALGRARL
jgi:hypothetical protein